MKAVALGFGRKTGAAALILDEAEPATVAGAGDAVGAGLAARAGTALAVDEGGATAFVALAAAAAAALAGLNGGMGGMEDVNRGGSLPVAGRVGLVVSEASDFLLVLEAVEACSEAVPLDFSFSFTSMGTISSGIGVLSFCFYQHRIVIIIQL